MVNMDPQALLASHAGFPIVICGYINSRCSSGQNSDQPPVGPGSIPGVSGPARVAGRAREAVNKMHDK